MTSNLLVNKLKDMVKRLPYARTLARRIIPAKQFDLCDRISSKAYNEIVMHFEGIAIPPIKLRDMVRKGAIMAEDFIIEGRQVFEAIEEFMSVNKVNLDKSTRIYEFGVGCGRVARHFIKAGYTDFTGSDVDSELVDWCYDNLCRKNGRSEAIKFFVNGYQPPIEQPD